MPDLIRLYIRQCIIGFALSAVFVGALFWFNIVGLWSLVSGSDVGWIAALMLFVFNGIVFGGVQFGIVIMRMGDDTPGGGRRVPVKTGSPLRAEVTALKPRKQRGLRRA